MRYNEKDLAILSKRSGQLEGRLQYRAPPGTFRDIGFRERYFRLVNNLLFYFRLSEFGQIDFREPVGVIVLENYSVRVETDSDLSFAFGILFLDEPDKRHVFTTRSDADANLWVNNLRQASYQHWKDKLQSMELNIQALKASCSNKSSIFPIQAVQQMSEEIDLLDLGERPSRVPRHNPFLPSTSPKPPPRNYSNNQINQSGNNNEGGSDLIRF